MWPGPGAAALSPGSEAEARASGPKVILQELKFTGKLGPAAAAGGAGLWAAAGTRRSGRATLPCGNRR